MNTPTILVTGATGNVGRPLVAGLLADGARVRALTRDPAAAGFPPGVAVAGGDYAAPGILAEAVRSADAVFLNIGALREHAGELIAAARGTGVSKIVMLSSIAVRDEGDQVLSLGRQHKAVEDAIKAAGVDWTILRCRGFATNTLTWAASVRAEGVVRFPYGEAALARNRSPRSGRPRRSGRPSVGRCASRNCHPGSSGSSPPSISRHPWSRIC